MSFSTASGTGATTVTIGADKVGSPTTPQIFNITMTTANQEYNQPLPANCKRYSIGTQDGTPIRYAFVTGKVATPTAPYYQTLSNQIDEENIDPSATLTLYFACATAGKIVQIVAWV